MYRRERLALDIDETIAWTIGLWIEGLISIGGNPEKLTVEQLAQKYPHDSYFPDYWKTPECLAWMKDRINDDKFQALIPPIPHASRVINKYRDRFACYVTVRGSNVASGTKKFLALNGFPDLPVIFRPNHVPHTQGVRWKAQFLHEQHPKLDGIIDDSRALIRELIDIGYQGQLYSFGNNDASLTGNFIPVVNWGAVEAILKS